MGAAATEDERVDDGVTPRHRQVLEKKGKKEETCEINGTKTKRIIYKENTFPPPDSKLKKCIRRWHSFTFKKVISAMQYILLYRTYMPIIENLIIRIKKNVKPKTLAFPKKFITPFMNSGRHVWTTNLH